MNLILPQNMDAPRIPAWFTRGLRELDPNLVIYWNHFKNRFVIDRTFRDAEGAHQTNVLIVETPEGGFMMPAQFTLDTIKAMDAWTNFGGNDEAALARFRKKHENEKAEYDAKQLEDARHGYRDAMLDDRVQINQALHLIQQHDVTRVNQ